MYKLSYTGGVAVGLVSRANVFIIGANGTIWKNATAASSASSSESSECPSDLDGPIHAMLRAREAESPPRAAHNTVCAP